jgi:hypothetical protein
MSFGIWPIVIFGRLTFGQLSFWADLRLAIWHFGQIYVRPIVIWQIDLWPIVIASFISIKIWPSNCNFRWQRAQIQDKMGRFTLGAIFCFLNETTYLSGLANTISKFCFSTRTNSK